MNMSSTPAHVGTALNDRGRFDATNLTLLALGAALALVYVLLLAWPMRIWQRPISPDVHLVGTLGISRGGALTYVVTVLLLFALYAAALILVMRRSGVRPWLVLGGASVFCLTLWATHPLTSADVFNYIASARIFWVHGENPLVVPPLAHPDDPFFGLLSFWQGLPSPYGPLWSLIAGAPVLAGGDDPRRTVLAFKAVSITFFLGTGVLLYLTAVRIRPDSGVPALLAYTWNPLAVFHVAGNGHNDAVMMFFVAAFLYALARGWTTAAIVALAASALVKYATLLIVPLLLVWWFRSRRQPSWKQLALGGGGAAALIVGLYAPFWSGFDTVRTALDEGSYFVVSVPAALRGALAQVMDLDRAEQITLVITRGAFLLVLAVLVLRLRGGRIAYLVEACFYAFFAYLCLAATYFSPWHVLWPLTFAVLLPFRRDLLWTAVTFSLTAMSVLVAAVWFREGFAPDPRADWYGMHLAAALAVFPLPILVWLWTVRYPARKPSRRGVHRHQEGGTPSVPMQEPRGNT
ncbi:MAG: hypothetical protein AB7R89_09295 [Dehalococcoidia bacterium]